MRRCVVAALLALGACSGADRNPVVPDPRAPVIAPTIRAPETPTPTPGAEPSPK